MRVFIIAFSTCATAFACTGVYVGSGLTENGSTYMGRSEDIGDRYGKVFNEAAANAIDPTSKFDYSLLIDSTKKLSTLDVLNFLAFRGEGSAWDYSAEPNLGNSNVIGTRSQSECHIFETRPGMPELLSVLQWQAMADAEFSIYVPYYSALVTDTNDSENTKHDVPKTGDTSNVMMYMVAAMMAAFVFVFGLKRKTN